MQDKTGQSPRNETDRKREEALYEALLALESADECRSFLQDLCTPKEIQALAERWLLARLLADGHSYRAISETTGASTTTVARVARFLTTEKNKGYKLILERTEISS